MKKCKEPLHTKAWNCTEKDFKNTISRTVLLCILAPRNLEGLSC
jgi:hypothetical protein